MYLYATRASLKNPDRSAQVWVPAVWPRPKELRDETIEVRFGRQRRPALSSVVRIAAEFSDNKSRHSQLGHDCAVFAVACATQHSQYAQAFNRAGALAVKLDGYTQLSQDEPPAEPVVPPGGIVAMGKVGYRDERLVLERPHVMVRATTDDLPPIYVSKLGVEGDVVFSSFEEAAKLYLPNGSAAVESLRIVNYDGISTRNELGT